MRKMLCRVAMLSIGILTVAGCAKNETIKKDEMVPVASNKTVASPAVKEAGVKTPPAKEVQSNRQSKEGAAKGTMTEAQLQAALAKIFFNFDSSSLSPEGRETLVKNAELLKSAGFKVRIEGNCDERGSDEYNLALGERRAQAAMQYLITMGVPAERLSMISYGEEKPADPGHDEAAWAKNRRDDFVVTVN